MSRLFTYRIVFVLAMLVTAQLVEAQVLLSRAIASFNKKSYAEAVELYEQFLEKEELMKAKGLSSYKDTVRLKNYKRAKLQLADSYLKLNRYEDAVEWYEKGFDNDMIEVDVDRKYHYNYGVALYALGEYARAKNSLDNFKKSDENDKTADQLIASLARIDEIISIKSDYDIGEMRYNTSGTEFAPTFYKDGIIFSSNALSEYPLKHTHSWDNSSFLDFYYATDKDREPMLFDDNINTKFHEGGICFNKRQDLVYFTRTNFNYIFPGKSTEGVVNIKLFTARLKEGKWTEIKEFPYNSSQYSIGEPAISPDGKTIYFVSDMPGGFGGTDVYMCKLDGTDWGEIINLGSKINTPGNERSPFVAEDGDLYFASDGLGGFGGLDIYHANHAGGESEMDHNLSDVHMALLGMDFINSHEDHFEDVVNLGEPINTSADDFGFIINDGRTKGYFASNRSSGTGGDDIYQFVQKGKGKLLGVFPPEEIKARSERRALEKQKAKAEKEAKYAAIKEKAEKKKQASGANDPVRIKGEKAIVSGKVYVQNGANKTPLGGAKIAVFKGNDIIKEFDSDAKGNFTIVLELGAKYDIMAQSQGLIEDEKPIDLSDKKNIKNELLELNLTKKK